MNKLCIKILTLPDWKTDQIWSIRSHSLCWERSGHVQNWLCASVWI